MPRNLLITGNKELSVQMNSKLTPYCECNVKHMLSSQIFDLVRDSENIYVHSDLHPQDGFVIHSGNLFNHLMYNMIEHGVVGKRIVVMRDYALIAWKELRKNFVASVFRTNSLWYLDANLNEVAVDIDKLITQELI